MIDWNIGLRPHPGSSGFAESVVPKPFRNRGARRRGRWGEAATGGVRYIRPETEGCWVDSLLRRRELPCVRFGNKLTLSVFCCCANIANLCGICKNRGRIRRFPPRSGVRRPAPACGRLGAGGASDGLPRRADAGSAFGPRLRRRKVAARRSVRVRDVRAVSSGGRAPFRCPSPRVRRPPSRTARIRARRPARSGCR